jgi:DNA-binding transcriptional LysR family regulator
MEMQQVRYFLALSRTLNFTRAAEECNVSQPSLTRAIRMLEEELGGDLLRRERTQSHLTELGQRMLPLLRQCYDSALSAKSLARSIGRNEVAPLALALSNSVSITLLTEPLAELMRAYPGVQLNLVRGAPKDLESHLKEGRVELAIAGPLGELWERLDAWTLFDESFELVLGTAHPLAPRSDINVADLQSEKLILHSACEMAKSCAETLGINGDIRINMHEVEVVEDIAALVRANLGVAVLPQSGARSQGLSPKPVAGLDLKRSVTVYAVAGRRRSTPAATLLNLLRAREWSHQVS